MMNETTILTMGRDELKRLIHEAVTAAMCGRQPIPPDTLCGTLVGIKEAAGLTGLAVKTIYEKTRARAIPHYKKRQRLYFSPSELSDWITAGRVPVRGEADTPAKVAVAGHRPEGGAR
jgi:excisionase family DNA binding protein